MNGQRLNKQSVLSYLGDFKQKNRQKYHIVKLGLFGSFSRDEVNEESDIDIAVELEKPKMFDIVGIKQDLEEAFARSVDIVRIRKGMNDFLKNRIEKEGFLFDKKLAIEILSQVYNATQTILKRFEPIKSSDDFIESDTGLEKLDAICMQLIAIGESLKNLDKITNKKLLIKYPQIEWKNVIGMRDIITHHYFDLDSEVVFDVCKNHIDELATTIKTILNSLTQKPKKGG